MYKLRFWQSLSVQFSALLLVLTTIPLLVLGFGNIQNVRESIVLNVRQKNLAHAEKIADEIDSHIDKVLSELKILAASPPLRSADWSASKYEIERFQTSRPDILLLTLTDAGGMVRVRISPTRLYDGNFLKSDSNSPGFIKAIKGATYLGELQLTQGSGTKLPVAVPLFDESGQKITGVLSAELSLRNMLETIGAVKVGKKGYVLVVDNRGHVVTHPDFSLVLSEKDATSIPEVQVLMKGVAEMDQAEFLPYTSLKGEKVLGVHAKVPSLGWGVIVQQPYDVAMALLHTLTLRLLILLSIILALTIFSVIYLVNFFIGPVTLLTRATGRLESGDLNVSLEVKRRNELGILTNSFNSMTKKLRDTMDAVRESEERFRTVVEQACDGLFLIKMDGRFVDCNRHACESLGYSRDELLQMTVPDIAPDFPEVRLNELVQELKPGKVITLEEYHRRKDRGTFPVEVRVSLVELGGNTHLLALARDITERKRAEAELQHLRNYLSNIIDSMPSGLVGVDVNSKVTLWNKKAEHTTGIAASLAEGKPLSEVFPQIASEITNIDESIQTREIRQEQKRARMTKQGIRYEDLTIYPLTANGVEGAVIRIDDVTDKVRIEEMMIQTEKMMYVGGLAAGMAHEINNPLAGMMQTARIMESRLSEQEKIPANLKAAEETGVSMEGIRKYMEARGILRMTRTINESGRRVAVIVNNMLSFARKSESRVSSHVLTDIIDKTLELAVTDYDLKKHYDFKLIKIKKEYEESLPPVPCESGKIQQVFLNILRNGAQAIQKTETRNPLLVIRTRFEKSRKMVSVEIEDNGTGMDEETRKRVFEPFFTTKPVGEGTGLGLSVSYFIVKENHRGEITVESKSGSGTKFIVSLPC